MEGQPLSRKTLGVALLAVLSLLLAACGGGSSDAPADPANGAANGSANGVPASGDAEVTLPPDEQTSELGEAVVELPPDESAEGLSEATADPAATLRITVTTSLEPLLVHIAQQMNFYQEAGVTLDVLVVDGAAQQAALLFSGQADGAITDMVHVTALVAGGADVRAVAAFPLVPPYYSVVASAASGITTLDGLRGQRIAVARGTAGHFAADDLLSGAGFTPEQVLYEDVPDDAARVELLATGQIAAAVLPEPYTAWAVQSQGALILATDAEAVGAPIVAAFRAEVLAQNPAAVIGFLQGTERAVGELSVDREQFRGVMLANTVLPEALQAGYPVPAFAGAGAPPPEQVQAIAAWMQRIGVIQAAPPYDRLVQQIIP